jgi:hypothetical protein
MENLIDCHGKKKGHDCAVTLRRFEFQRYSISNTSSPESPPFKVPIGVRTHSWRRVVCRPAYAPACCSAMSPITGNLNICP